MSFCNLPLLALPIIYNYCYNNNIIAILYILNRYFCSYRHNFTCYNLGYNSPSSAIFLATPKPLLINTPRCEGVAEYFDLKKYKESVDELDTPETASEIVIDCL